MSCDLFIFSKNFLKKYIKFNWKNDKNARGTKHGLFSDWMREKYVSCLYEKRWYFVIIIFLNFVKIINTFFKIKIRFYKKLFNNLFCEIVNFIKL